MTRTSWHWFWMFLTFEAVILAVVFYFGAGANGNPANIGPVSPQLKPLAVELQHLFAMLEAALFFLWVSVAVLSGTAWAACELGFRGRRRYLAWEKRIDERFSALAREKGIQLGVRD